ncbi:dephospho-CoA kinase [Paenibacillus mucilaginosus]|uniref:Dephospho-CoA kinase n=3 Tax=Paenibacillus mucilaginosus TaxID=61624 RepID=H6NCD0_9BACL|nr:dephospho-CoA kinase [Paenibacillus mucilaginosus]AEI39868.1 dephospho-CoA kinase [Paenibacillus mucilaginosus KNP414]AFC28543.1 dephospho-CoA kinase [Paenibacillus mucilaginosus 3016]AFH60709.1 dephospho-CoA kinase [Paenibacillus mucilaginosus K02]MCG7217188.1 dephospho-CoA kinase [Paenibacillus mucilaginosus]WDM29146.1 dephospho-CoA kinase [Paenibacillus mucilaginosus]
MNIGLTGGIACGKSTVADMLVRRGALLVDADRIAREVVMPGTPVLAQVIARFGEDLLLPDGSLHRKKLGERVFGNPEALKDLEGLLHPPIRAAMRERMRTLEAQHPDKLVVVDVPLLYESGLQEQYEQVMVVYVPRAVQLQRLMKRDGIDEEAAVRRLQAQWDIEEKRRLADVLIDNSGTLEETELQVQRFWDERGLS